ncbi:MAG: 3-hydroxybutyryl-CoA dehydrogenase [Ignavibacteriaceae bacterium]|nr:3-hydroxybutyryl-CoA dehydrogenase [Ignavibacteriaceae bacterium]
MKKIFLTGDENIKEELRLKLKDCEYTDNLKDTNIAVECTNYPRGEKTDIIKQLDAELNPSMPILTSSLCVAVWEQAAVCKNPERLIGIGLYPTISKTKLIELAPSRLTNDETTEKVKKFFSEQKIECSVVPDVPGLVFPRIISMIINEAAQVYAEKTASREDIDTAMKLGTNYPYGPLEWTDKLGVGLI